MLLNYNLSLYREICANFKHDIVFFIFLNYNAKAETFSQLNIILNKLKLKKKL